MGLNTENARSFNASLKKAISELTGQKVKVEIINSYKFPKCYVVVYPETEFDNDFRLRVFDVCNATREGLRDPNNVCYGNIRSNMVSTVVSKWVELFTE